MQSACGCRYIGGGKRPARPHAVSTPRAADFGDVAGQEHVAVQVGKQDFLSSVRQASGTRSRGTGGPPRRASMVTHQGCDTDEYRPVAPCERRDLCFARLVECAFRARALYVTAKDRRVVILRAFIKKTERKRQRQRSIWRSEGQRN